MNDQTKVVVRNDGGAVLGPLWIAGWLFTIGYLKLSLMKGAVAIVAWPYFLGVFFHR